jgi:hypothetical protein
MDGQRRFKISIQSKIQVEKCSKKNGTRSGGSEIREPVNRKQLLFINIHKLRLDKQLTEDNN